jgi:hypothetical protein
LDTAIDARWPSFPNGLKESLKITGAISLSVGCGGGVEPCSGTVARERSSPSLFADWDILVLKGTDRRWTVASYMGVSPLFTQTTSPVASNLAVKV